MSRKHRFVGIKYKRYFFAFFYFENTLQLRESACCGIGCIVHQSPDFAMLAIKEGALPLLLMNVQLNEIRLKQIATLAFADIAKHSSDHADEIVRAGGLAHFAGQIDNVDIKLKVV